MDTLKNIRKSTIPITYSLPIGLWLLIVGIQQDFFTGSPSLNAHSLLSILFLVHFTSSLPKEKVEETAFGFWFAGLAVQLIHLFVRDSFQIILPFGLVVVSGLFRQANKGDFFNAMLWLLLLAFLPFEWGYIIGISAMTMAGMQNEEGRTYLLLFAFALTGGAFISTSGLSVLAFIGSLLLANWEGDTELQVSFPAFVLSLVLSYGTYFFIAILLLTA